MSTTPTVYEIKQDNIVYPISVRIAEEVTTLARTMGWQEPEEE